MWEAWVRSLGQEDPLEKEMATHSSILAWRIPWTEEPGGLQSMGSQRVGRTRLSNFTVYRLLTRYLSKERIQSFLSHPLIILFSSLLKNLEGSWASLVAQRVKHPSAMQETWVQSLGREHPLEKDMATHSSTLDWKIPWTEKPGRLQSTGLQRVGHD